MMKKVYDHRLVGYSLVEILVVLTITGAIFGLGYSGFRDFARRQSINSTAKTFKTDIKLAQEQAFSGKKVSGCVVLDGYKIFVDTSNSFYTISATCSSSGTTSDYEIKSKEFSEDVVVTIVPINTFTFKSIGHGTDITAGDTVVVTFAQKGGGYSVPVIVAASGGID
ncbi:MAG: type II secretion system protein [Patescibacteria group bacterium]